MKANQFLASTLISLGIAVGGAAMFAAPASAAVCGFTPITSNAVGGGDDGRYEAGVYNHCGSSSNLSVQVNYYYMHEFACVTPGETTFTAHPNKGALISVKGTGVTC